MAKMLILVTNHDTLGDSNEENGTYAPELTHAVHVFLAAGVEYDIVSIEGGKAPIYGADAEDDAINASVLKNDEFQGRINNTIPLAQVDANNYNAVFYPGGFGLLSDLATDESAARVSAAIYESGGVLGAVCHGPAGLLPVTLSNGEKLLANKAVTGFTREEEVDYGTIDKIPFLLEESLARQAALYSKVQPWGEHVVEDARVITGQNPASAHGVAEAMIAQLG